MYFHLSTVFTPVIVLVIEYYFSNVTVLVLKDKCSVLFPPLMGIRCTAGYNLMAVPVLGETQNLIIASFSIHELDVEFE